MLLLHAAMAAVDEAVMDLVRAGMRGLKVAGRHDKVYKDECVFSFATPETPGGLFINLTTFQVRVGDRS